MTALREGSELLPQDEVLEGQVAAARARQNCCLEQNADEAKHVVDGSRSSLRGQETASDGVYGRDRQLPTSIDGGADPQLALL